MWHVLVTPEFVHAIVATVVVMLLVHVILVYVHVIAEIARDMQLVHVMEVYALVIPEIVDRTHTVPVIQEYVHVIQVTALVTMQLLVLATEVLLEDTLAQ